jgi:transcriptional regulator of acetoin/glycerol metabolism
MTEHSTTITSASLGRRPEAAVANAIPQLVLLAISDDLQSPSSRHLLEDVDEVRFGRGERETTRRIDGGRRVLELRVPDRRMSSSHGSLVRTKAGWVLDDPESKNGAIVDGTVTRRTAIVDGKLFELGRTFFLFRTTPTDPTALDVTDAMLSPIPGLATFAGDLAERFAALSRIAPTLISVLLHGETGTGKELVARAVHDQSGRKGPFVAVNCGALPPNLIEAELFGHRRGAFTGAVGERLGFVRSADGGTLFLDEVAELPPASQAAFLRVLQEREVVPVGDDRAVKVDVRLCAATLRDLEALVAANEFRGDLYARLFGFSLTLPALRDRREDFGMLVRRLLRAIPGGAAIRLAPSALRALICHDWRFNIRELEKVLTTAVALAPEGLVELAHLPDSMRQQQAAAPPAPPPDAEPDELRDRLIALLTEHRGNVLAVSKALEARRTQVYRWIRRYKLDVDTFRR